MKIMIWAAVLIGLAITFGMVSFAVAGETQSTGTADLDLAGINSISPSTGTPLVKSITYYVNGVKQPTITSPVGNPHIDVNRNDTIMFKVKCTYSGPGTGYLLVFDADSLYEESALLKSGATTTKQVVRSFTYFDTGTHQIYFDAMGSGDPCRPDIGPGDYHAVTVHVN